VAKLLTGIEAAELPTTLVATTVMAYVSPSVSPSMVQLSAVVAEHVTTPPLPSFAVTVYPVTAKPPFDSGALHVIVEYPVPGVVVTEVGASGALKE
jgi:hypothetical protein